MSRGRGGVDINPPDLGIHVDGPEGDWYRIARVTFDLGTEVEEPIEINFYYQKALPYDITEDPGDSWYSWSGDRKFVYGDVETGIDLVDFTAESLSDRIALRWETASERDNAGFYVWRRVVAAGERIEGARRMAPSVRTTGARRSMDRYEARAERLDAQWVPITENLIPAEGSASEGATYELDDVDVTQGTVYEYRLEGRGSVRRERVPRAGAGALRRSGRDAADRGRRGRRSDRDRSGRRSSTLRCRPNSVFGRAPEVRNPDCSIP